jgi:hypothetical protein
MCLPCRRTTADAGDCRCFAAGVGVYLTDIAVFETRHVDELRTFLFVLGTRPGDPGTASLLI